MMNMPTMRGGPIKAEPEPPQSIPTPTPPIESTIREGVDCTMFSSLPPMASGADIYARQFYRSSKVPFRRYLPVVKQQ